MFPNYEMSVVPATEPGTLELRKDKANNYWRVFFGWLAVMAVMKSSAWLPSMAASLRTITCVRSGIASYSRASQRFSHPLPKTMG